MYNEEWDKVKPITAEDYQQMDEFDDLNRKEQTSLRNKYEIEAQNIRPKPKPFVYPLFIYEKLRHLHSGVQCFVQAVGIDFKGLSQFRRDFEIRLTYFSIGANAYEAEAKQFFEEIERRNLRYQYLFIRSHKAYVFLEKPEHIEIWLENWPRKANGYRPLVETIGWRGELIESIQHKIDDFNYYRN